MLSVPPLMLPTGSWLCAARTHGFRDAGDGLRARGIIVLGGSVGSVEVPFRPVFDPERIVAPPSAPSPPPDGTDQRTTFLVHDPGDGLSQLDAPARASTSPRGDIPAASLGFFPMARRWVFAQCWHEGVGTGRIRG